MYKQEDRIETVSRMRHTAKPGPEMRKSVRVPVMFPASVTRNDREYLGIVLNVSVDGMFIKTVEFLPAHSDVEILFHLPVSRYPLKIGAKIAWCSKIVGPEGTICGMGLQFDNHYLAERLLLKTFIDHLLAGKQ